MRVSQLSPLEALAAFRGSARHFDLGGHRIAFWTEGLGERPGPPLLLVHGFPTASYDWWRVWDRLAGRHALIACDMLGFGMSAKPQGARFPLTVQADIQEALAAHLGIGEVLALVHDYGVTVGQELLARQRDGGQRLAIRAMAFLNGGLFPEQHRATPGQLALLSEKGPELAARQTREGFGAGIAGVFGPHTQPGAEELDALWDLVSERDGHLLLPPLLSYIPQRRENRERWVGALTAAIVPMRLVNGVLDPVSGGHAADRYEELVPDADVVRLDDVGHWPQLEAPERVADAVLEFLARH